jgi:hypothetical protein
MAKPLKLTVEERTALLQSIEQARRRVLDFADELTENDARVILRETLSDAFNTVLRNHRNERQLT